MTIIFTICSNNYLAQAKTLMDSVSIHHPYFKLIIGLVDRYSNQIDYSFFNKTEIIPVEKLNISRWNEMLVEYDIIELNTSVKPSYFKYLLEVYPEATNILYFDPDIKIFTKLDDLLLKLEKNNILLTPHIHTPINLDNQSPQEQTFLSRGIYNLGFIAIRMKTEASLCFLNWWEERCIHRCKKDIGQGLFVDQLWISQAHIFFEGVHILPQYGYNMAPWNLHERYIERKDDRGYLLNDASYMVFYHFSSFDYKIPGQLNKSFYNRFSMEQRPDLEPLYNLYCQELILNKVEDFHSIPCAYFNVANSIQNPEFRQKNSNFKHILREIFPPFLYRFFVRLIHLLHA